MGHEGPCVLGLDGGGTRTTCVILDGAGREIGRGLGGPSNHQSVGVEVAQQAMAEAVAMARQAAGNPPLAAACFGMAGLDREEDLRLLRRMVREVLPDVRAEVVHDADIALVGGTGGRRHGVVVIAGTGSVAVGFTADGRTARAGGWGHVLGDEGSGYDLARRGLNAASRAVDGRGPATLLSMRLPQAVGVPTLEAVADRVYLERWTAAQVASLAPAVLAAAEEGDAVASEIVRAAGHELALAALSVIRALGMEKQTFPVVLSGGIFAGSPRMVEAVRREVQALAPGADPHLPRNEPAVGAAWIALERAKTASQTAP